MPLPPGLAVRLQDSSLHAKVMGADEAATLIAVGANVGMSGFTGAAYPKAVPQALAARLAALHATGQTQARIGLWTWTSTGPELDGALPRAHGVAPRPH